MSIVLVTKGRLGGVGGDGEPVYYYEQFSALTLDVEQTTTLEVSYEDFDEAISIEVEVT